MVHLRTRGITLIVWLTLAFLLAPQLPAEYLPLHSLVLLVALLLPVEQVSQALLLGTVLAANLAAYAAARWAGLPVAAPPLYLIQLALSSGSVLLVRSVRAMIDSFDDGVWRFVLNGGLSKVRPWDEVQIEAARELHRSRRYNRPLSMVLLDVEPPAGPREANSHPALAQPFAGYEASICVAQLAVEQLRTLDFVAWSYRPRRLLFVLTEADGAAAQQFTDRFSSLVRQETGLGIRVGLASFPEHALTLDDLYQRAEAVLDERISSEGYRMPMLTAREHRG